MKRLIIAGLTAGLTVGLMVPSLGQGSGTSEPCAGQSNTSDREGGAAKTSSNPTEPGNTSC